MGQILGLVQLLVINLDGLGRLVMCYLWRCKANFSLCVK